MEIVFPKIISLKLKKCFNDKRKKDVLQIIFVSISFFRGQSKYHGIWIFTTGVPSYRLRGTRCFVFKTDVCSQEKSSLSVVEISLEIFTLKIKFFSPVFSVKFEIRVSKTFHKKIFESKNRKMPNIFRETLVTSEV